MIGSNRYELTAALQCLHETGRTIARIVVTQSRVKFMSGAPIPRACDLHVVGAQASRLFFGRVHQRSTDSLASKCVVDNESDQTPTTGSMFKQGEDVQRGYTSDRASNLSDQECALRIGQPVFQPGFYFALCGRISQLPEQGSKRRRVGGNDSSDRDRHYDSVAPRHNPV